MESNFVSTLSFEQEIDNLRAKLTESESLVSRLRMEYKEKQLNFENKILKLELIIKQKDELVSQLRAQQEKNQNFKLVTELEGKLKHAEKMINNLRQQSKKTRSTSLFGTKKMRVNSLNKVSTDNRRESFDISNNLNNNINGLRRHTTVVNLQKPDPSLIDQERSLKNVKHLHKTIAKFQELVSEEKNTKQEYKEELNVIAHKNEKLNDELKTMLCKVEELEKEKLLFLQNIDSLKIINEELTVKNDFMKHKMEQLNKKADKADLANSNNNIELTEYKMKLEEIQSLYNETNFELKQTEKMLNQVQEEYEERLEIGQAQIEQKDVELEQLKEKLETNIQKNVEYLDRIGKEQEDKERLKQRLLKEFELIELNYLNKISELESIIENSSHIEEEGSKQNINLNPSFLNKNKLSMLEAHKLDISYDHEVSELQLTQELKENEKSLVLLNSEEDNSRGSFQKNRIRLNQNSNKQEEGIGDAYIDNQMTEKTDDFLHYIEEINAKNEEIQMLKEELRIQTSYSKVQELENKVDNLNLQIKHLNEELANNRLIFEKEKELLKDNIETINNSYIHIKIKYTDMASTRDDIVMGFNRKIKKLQYQIGLYEKMIDGEQVR